MKIVKSLEDAGLFIKGVSKTIKKETNEQKCGFISMVLDTLGASLLENVLTGEGVKWSNTPGKRVMQAGESTIRATNCLNKTESLFFSEKNPLPQINVACKGLGLWQQNLARFNIDMGGKCENLEFEKLSHYLNLLNFRLFSEQILSRVVGNFLKHKSQ